MRRIEYFSNSEFEEQPSNLELFSLIQDLRTKKFPIRQQYRLLIQEYSKYVQTKKSTLNKETLDEIDKMLISKINVMINECEEGMLQSRPLDVQLGMTQPKLKKAATQFTRIYKRMMIMRKKLNYIPREIQSQVDDAYKKLIGQIRGIVFKPVLNLFSFDPEDLPEDIDPTSEEALLLVNGNPTLEQLREIILGAFKKDNIDANIEIRDNQIIIKYEDSSNQE